MKNFFHPFHALIQTKTFVAGGLLMAAASLLALLVSKPAQTASVSSRVLQGRLETASITGTLETPRYAHTATLLNNGKVLVVGGVGGYGGSNNPLNSAELYTPETGVWANTGNLATARGYHTATLLNNGKVLVVGGQGNSDVLKSAELYDPQVGTWSSAGNLPVAGSQHTATLLSNGKVLVVGGADGNTPLNTSALYDPATNAWTNTSSSPSVRSSHTATLLDNGRVLVTGGYDSGTLNSVEIYDANDDTWNSSLNLTFARRSHTATRLRDGRVLAVGGQGSSTTLSSAELYDANTEAWSMAASMTTARRLHTATLLSNGNVLVLGGFNSSGALNSAELYDPTTDAWSTEAPLTTTRAQHTATRLENNSVLVAAGQNGSGTLSSAELYEICIAPEITVEPTAQAVCEGSAVTFSVTAIGSGLTYQWRKDGADISGATARTYTINAVTEANVDRYDVVVTGTCGAATSRAVTLTLSLPTISAQPTSVTANLGTAASFSVTAEGADLTYQWRKNGLALSGATAKTYTINAVGASDFGRYDVIVTGTCGATYSQGAMLLVNGGPGSADSSWSGTGQMLAARYQHTATLLGNGKVLVTGGYDGTSNLSSAELYDPAAGTWNSTGSLTVVRRYHTATILNDGKVLVVGGRGSSSALSGTELYDPASGTWSSSGPLITGRRHHTATLLGNGKVLVTGGYSGAVYLNNAELYDPVTGIWKNAGTFTNARQYHTATLLNDGRVLIVGGSSGSTLSSAQLYDPEANTWSAANGLATARQYHTATLLSDGRVFVVGGENNAGAALSSAEVYDPATNSWSAAADLDVAREYHTATLLSSGNLLTVGGLGNGALDSAALYAATTNTWSATGNLVAARQHHTATLLNNGKVLVAGGLNSGALRNAELYDLVPCTPAAISTQPANQTVTVGSQASFTVAATGSPTPTVQWQLSTDGGTTFTDIAGATSLTLNLTTTMGHNGNRVRVIARNSCGTPASPVTSNVATLTVQPAGTATVLASAANPSVWGQSVTLTATVSSSAGTPTGTVTFTNGTTTLGTVTLSNGQASYSTSAFSVASHAITARYDGAANFASSTASTLTQVVNKAATAVVIASSAHPARHGQSVVVTATVAALAPGVGVPSGTVTFKAGATTLGSGTLSGGTATFTTATLAVGSHAITAVYEGEGNWLGSTSSTLAQTIDKAAVTVALTSAANTSVFGQSVNLTATLSALAPGSGVPGGTVEFFASATSLGTGTLSNGVATLTTSALSAGTHVLTAVYVGNSDFTGAASSALSHTVSKANTTVALASSTNSATYGQGVTFTATVSAGTGQVTFKSGTTTLGTSQVSNGTATLTLPTLGAGNHALTAEYSGDSSYQASTSNALAQTITKVLLTVTAANQARTYGAANPEFTVSYNGFVNNESANVLSGTPQLSTTATTGSHVGAYPIVLAAGTLNAANYSFTFVNGTLTIQPATLTVTAEPKTKVYGTANPPLTASFAGLMNGDTMNLAAGSAQLATNALPNSPVGTYEITVSGVTNADYAINFVPGTLTVTPSTPAVNLTVNRTPSALGQSVTFTASTQATTPHGSRPGGTITFAVDGTTVGSAIMNAAGEATFSTSTLPLGSRTITATYGGDNNYQAKTKEMAQTVAKALSFTRLTSSANPASTSQPVTLTAQVRGNNGTPTGQVEFFVGAQSLGVAPLSNGAASIAVNTLAEATHAVTAAYQGDASFATSVSAALSQQVVAGCTFTLSQKEVIADAAGGNYTITVDTRNGCAWQIENTNAWLTTSQTVVNGQPVVTLTVAAQPTTTVRVGKLKIAGQTVTVTQSRALALVGAASYEKTALAKEALASLFGTNLASGTANATSLPLPTKLADVRIKVRDASGTEQFASLLFVSPSQLNFQLPPSLPEGDIVVTVLHETDEVSAGKFHLTNVAPGVFAADASGTGLAAASIQRMTPDGTQSAAAVAAYNFATNVYEPLPINLNTSSSLVSDEVYLVLYGTGLRHHTSLANMTAQVGGLDAEVLFAGDQLQYVGLDQINLRLPQGLAGRGLVEVVLFVDGKATNPVKIFIR